MRSSGVEYVVRYPVAPQSVPRSRGQPSLDRTAALIYTNSTITARRVKPACGRTPPTDHRSLSTRFEKSLRVTRRASCALPRWSAATLVLAATMQQPRVLSLLSASTEIVFRLGCGHMLVGRSHGCDDPPLATTLDIATAPKMDPNASSRDIDNAVRVQIDAGGPVYHIYNSIVASAKRKCNVFPTCAHSFSARSARRSLLQCTLLQCTNAER